MPRKQTTNKEPTAKNSICRAIGHDWLQVGEYWRGCQQERCRACQHFVNGRWVDAAPFYRRHVPVETDGTRPYLRQRGLWTEKGDNQ